MEKQTSKILGLVLLKANDTLIRLIVSVSLVVIAICAVAGSAYSERDVRREMNDAIAAIGLEATGPEVKAAPAPEVMEKVVGLTSSKPPAAPPAPAMAPAPTAIPPMSQERPGKLESYIRNNPSIRKAEQLRSDPRLNSLSQSVRGDFLNEFGTLMFSKAVSIRDSLLERTHAIDKEQMEMEDLSFQFRDDVATFRIDEAVLEAEILEHNRKVAAIANDVRSYENDVAIYNNSLADCAKRVADCESQVAAYNAEAANYSAQCLGAPLMPGPYARCTSWYGQLNSRKDFLETWKAQLSEERARLQRDFSSLNLRKSALQKRADEINVRKAAFDARSAALEKRRAQLLAEEKKLADWEVSIKPQWDFELKRINEWQALVDKFNTRLEKALSEVS
jgi:hypothetical protein